MNGFALEVKMIEWTCNCTSHPDGCCTDRTERKKPKVHRDVYFGNFGYGVKSKDEAIEKFDRIFANVGAPDAMSPDPRGVSLKCNFCPAEAGFIERGKAVCFEHRGRA